VHRLVIELEIVGRQLLLGKLRAAIGIACGAGLILLALAVVSGRPMSLALGAQRFAGPRQLAGAILARAS